MADKIYYTGKAYNKAGASLTVIEEPVKNSIKCKCNICGTVDTYKVSDLKAGNVLACKSCRQGVNIGDKFDTLEVKDFIIHDRKLKAAMYCSGCNKKFIHDIRIITSKGYKCPVCAKTKAIAVPIKGGSTPVTAKSSNNEKATPKNLLGTIVSFDETPQMKIVNPGFRGDFIFNGTVLKLSKTGGRVSEHLRGQCVHCGGTTTESENYFIKHEYKCQKCNKINSDKRNIIENTNWVGYARHNIEIVKTKKDSNGVVMAETRCLACGHKMEVPVVTIFSDPELTCIQCGDTNITVECPLCHKNHIKTTLRKMYTARTNTNTSVKQGVTCGKNIVEYSEILLQHETAMGLERVRKKYKGYTLDERIPGHDETPTIFKFKEGYIGTDGEQYHTCMCEVHNKLMVLTDDEIRSYKHEYCADTRMMPYNPNIKPKKRH